MKQTLYIALSLVLSVSTGCGSRSAHTHDHDGHDHDHDHETEHIHSDGDDHDHDDHDHDHDHDGHDHGHKEEHGPDVIVLAPEKAKASGVKADTVSAGTFNSVIKTSGRVMPASGDETTVSATVGGIVKFNRPLTEGAEIGRGTPVVTISTASLPDGDIVRRTRIAYEQARAEYERAESLLADRLVTQRDFEAAKAEYERASLAYEAAGKGRTGGGVSVSSPAGGFVKQLMVKEGDYVEIGQPIMTVTKNRNLYLRADVSERDFSELRNISSARFSTAYASGKIYDLAEMGGKVVSYGRTPGAGGAFIPVTFEFNNTGDILPDSYAEVYLIGRQKPDVISIPVGALTEEQGVFFVYVREDEDCYRKREVKTGLNDGRRVEILSGLAPGDVVVTEGTVYVRLAGASASIPGHTHNH